MSGSDQSLAGRRWRIGSSQCWATITFYMHPDYPGQCNLNNLLSRTHEINRAALHFMNQTVKCDFTSYLGILQKKLKCWFFFFKLVRKMDLLSCTCSDLCKILLNPWKILWHSVVTTVWSVTHTYWQMTLWCHQIWILIDYSKLKILQMS